MKLALQIQPSKLFFKTGFAVCCILFLVITGYRQASVAADLKPNGLNLYIDKNSLAWQTDTRFLSFSVDTAFWLGIDFWNSSPGAPKKVDFNNPKLRYLTQNLGPSYLRVGGTAADQVNYGFNLTQPSRDFQLSIPSVKPENWDHLMSFVTDLNLSLFFTVNAGPLNRSSGGIFQQDVWTPDQLISLLQYSNHRGDKNITWELGNEINAYWLIHGLSSGVSPEQYAKDYTLAQRTLNKLRSGEKLAGPASAVWPELGETPAIGGIAAPYTEITPGFLSVTKDFGTNVDIITWHFYPMQSDRCKIASRRASLDKLMDLSTFDEFKIWATQFLRMRSQYQPKAKLWLGESGSAQCGGQSGLSDRFISTLWWLDELGAAAVTNHDVVIRQSLVGSDYGLLKEGSYEPNPDYFSSLLWKRLMGEKVLKVKLLRDFQPIGTFEHPGSLRVYAHCTSNQLLPSNKGSVSLLFLNLSGVKSELIHLPTERHPWLEWQLKSNDLVSSTLMLNEKALELNRDGTLPDMAPLLHEVSNAIEAIRIEPFSANFIVLPEANLEICHSGT